MVGCPGGCVRYASPEEWENGIPVDEFHERLQTRLEIAEWIAEYTTENYVSDKNANKRSRKLGVHL